MQIGFTQFLSLVTHNPLMMITAVLTLAVIMVNGWTDAPNAIATCVSTRALPAKQAIMMAAVMNFCVSMHHSVVSKPSGYPASASSDFAFSMSVS